MADYIRSNILSQAYIHVEAPDLTEDQLAEIVKELEAFIAARGPFFIYEGAQTTIQLKDGSLKIYGTILGSLVLALSQYASMRDGIRYLVEDSQRVAQCINSEGLFLTGSRHDAVLRVEARTGVVGRLNDAVLRLESIRRQLSYEHVDTTAQQIAELEIEIQTLVDQLQDPKDPPYVKSELCKLVLKLLPLNPIGDPGDPKKPRRREGPDEIALYRQRRREILKYLGNAN